MLDRRDMCRRQTPGKERERREGQIDSIVLRVRAPHHQIDVESRKLCALESQGCSLPSTARTLLIRQS